MSNRPTRLRCRAAAGGKRETISNRDSAELAFSRCILMAAYKIHCTVGSLVVGIDIREFSRNPRGGGSISVNPGGVAVRKRGR
jgi:hypothetical protein